MKNIFDLNSNKKSALRALSDEICELKMVSSKARFLINELHELYFNGDGADAFVEDASDACAAREMDYERAQMLFNIAADFVVEVDQMISYAESVADSELDSVDVRINLT